MFLVPPDLARRTGPDWRTAIRDLLLRALVPAVALWVAVIAFGQLLTGPLVGWNHSESALNRSLLVASEKQGPAHPIYAPPVFAAVRRRISCAAGLMASSLAKPLRALCRWKELS
jgi:hypothetical protein